MLLGHVTKGDIRIDGQEFGTIAQFNDIYQNSLEQKLQ